MPSGFGVGVAATGTVTVVNVVWVRSGRSPRAWDGWMGSGPRSRSFDGSHPIRSLKVPGRDGVTVASLLDICLFLRYVAPRVFQSGVARGRGRILSREAATSRCCTAMADVAVGWLLKVWVVVSAMVRAAEIGKCILIK